MVLCESVHYQSIEIEVFQDKGGIEMKNEVVKNMPNESKPSKEIRCIDCLQAHWHHAERDGVECKCLLINAVTWNEGRGKNGIEECTGCEDEMKLPSDTPCSTCNLSVWYVDSGKLQGYCRDIFRKIHGEDIKGHKIPDIKECNRHQERQVL